MLILTARAQSDCWIVGDRYLVWPFPYAMFLLPSSFRLFHSVSANNGVNDGFRGFIVVTPYLQSTLADATTFVFALSKLRDMYGDCIPVP